MATLHRDLGVCPTSLFDEMQAQLFDSMDRLSQLHIDTPQLVVVGAQSSGKSSVLEALVRFHFPVDSVKPTTRFPIKLVLRKAINESTRVRIEPDKLRSKEEKTRLHRLADDLSGDHFDRIMERAKAGLGVLPPGTPDEASDKIRTFCNDVLVIERHGPSLPRLELVDLPGLFDAATAEQTLEDGDMVSDMVSRYIESPMNIILLVVSAEVKDYSNVPALGMLQRMLQKDPALKRRVVCVVTRPDEAGSLQETQRVLGKQSPFAESFTRPWHILRNQDQEARRKHQSLDQRDLIEEEFFGQPDWEAVPSSQKGIGALRETLTSMIRDHTRDQLPGVISAVNAGIETATAQLNSALQARATPKARRDYLSDVAEKFASLTREAAQGTFKNKKCEKEHRIGDTCQECNGFFALYARNDVESQQKRLRPNVRALNRAFAAAMRRFGRTTVENGNEGATTGTSQPVDEPSQPSGDGEQVFQLHRQAKYYVHDMPESQSRKDYENLVSENTERWKALGPGREPSDGAYWGLFAHQAKKWNKIATQHVKAVWEVVGEFIELALAASCPDRDVLDALRRLLVNPNLERLQVKADRALRDLVSCHGEANPGFYDSLVDARAAREHAEAFLQRLAMMRPESRDNIETGGSSNAPGAEQVNGQQDASTQQANNLPRQDAKLKSPQPTNSQRSAEPKATARDRNSKDREVMITFALENAIATLGSSNPILTNPMVRKAVVPMIARHISAAFEPNSDADNKDKVKRAETNIRKTIHGVLPPKSADLTAANVISQVEMHYEAIQTSFVCYVASLVVEQRIMGRLPDAILTEKIIRGMTDDEINRIAGEKPSDAKKREAIQRDLKTMKEVLNTMEDYQRAT